MRFTLKVKGGHTAILLHCYAHRNAAAHSTHVSPTTCTRFNTHTLHPPWLYLIHRWCAEAEQEARSAKEACGSRQGYS